MTREARAVEMRSGGTSLAVIAAEFGVSKSTVLRWTDPGQAERSRQYAHQWKENNRERNRARDRERRMPCDRCGVLRKGHREGLCRQCFSVAKEKRWNGIEALWSAGLKMPEICAELGISKDYLAVEMSRMRKAGRNLPYRYKAWERKAAA